jgi:uncharacterized protein YqcC (DUF446 family)
VVQRFLIWLTALAAVACICVFFLVQPTQLIILPMLVLFSAGVPLLFSVVAQKRGGQNRMSNKTLPDYAVVAARLAEIEAEMRRVRLWQAEPLAPQKYQFTRAFAGDTMSYDQWLQFVFIPRVKQIIEAKGQFPGSSSVGAQAVREFDGNREADQLIHLLCEFDSLFRS